MTARDQMVGPWQVPVADVAVTTMGYQGYAGEAFAMGERTPVAVLDAPASGRMAIAEALTNMAAGAHRQARRRQTPPTGWRRAACRRARMPACSTPSKAISDLCQQIGVSIPVGKDSLSMRTAWDEAGEKKQVVSPLSLIVTAFSAVGDVRKTLTPVQLDRDCGEPT